MSHLITYILAISLATLSWGSVDRVVLKISKEGELLQKYSHKMLDIHPESFSIRTITPWTNSIMDFKAVPLKSILGDISNDFNTVHLIAENGFETKKSIQFLLDADAFLAFKEAGEYMRLRDKGPVWLLYPYSQRPELNGPYHNQSAVWMLSEINAFNE